MRRHNLCTRYPEVSGDPCPRQETDGHADHCRRALHAAVFAAGLRGQPRPVRLEVSFEMTDRRDDSHCDNERLCPEGTVTEDRYRGRKFTRTQRFLLSPGRSAANLGLSAACVCIIAGTKRFQRI